MYLVIAVDEGDCPPVAYLFKEFHCARAKCKDLCTSNFYNVTPDAKETDFNAIEVGWNINPFDDSSYHVSIQAICSQ